MKAFALVNQFNRIQWCITMDNGKVWRTPAIFQSKDEALQWVKSENVSEALDDGQAIKEVEVNVVLANLKKLDGGTDEL